MAFKPGKKAGSKADLLQTTTASLPQMTMESLPDLSNENDPASLSDQAETGHIDAITLDEYGPEISGREPDPEPEGLLTKDQFFTNFRGLFDVPNVFISPPLASLPIDPRDQSAKAAADALYDICAKVSWMKWLLSPSGDWAKLAMCMAPFLLMKFAAIKMELADREAARRAAKAKPVAAAPANDNAPAPVSNPVEVIEQ